MSSCMQPETSRTGPTNSKLDIQATNRATNTTGCPYRLPKGLVCYKWWHARSNTPENMFINCKYTHQATVRPSSLKSAWNPTCKQNKDRLLPYRWSPTRIEPKRGENELIWVAGTLPESRRNLWYQNFPSISSQGWTPYLPSSLN